MENWTVQNAEGRHEEVELERWSWLVIYETGEVFQQFELGGRFHRFNEIDQGRVRLFSLFKVDEPTKRVDIPVDPRTMQIFHFYRNVKFWYMQGFARVYVFGYKLRGTKHAVYNFILPDDRVITSPVSDVPLERFGVNEHENDAAG